MQKPYAGRIRGWKGLLLLTVNVLYFVGHYDYFLPSVLYGSEAVDQKIQADFIILGTGNHQDTVDFIRSKEKASSLFNHIKVVDDSDLMQEPSTYELRKAVQKKYDAVFAEFGRSVYEYSKIVISFDERNSFGIYLSDLEEKVNVTVLVKNLSFFERDAYRLLDSGDRNVFCELQREYQVLGIDAGYSVNDIVLLESGQENRPYKGRKVSCFNVGERLRQLSEETFQSLCEYFQLDHTGFEGSFNLLYLDAYWFDFVYFGAERNYFSAYEIFRESVDNSNLPLIVRIDSRWSIDNSRIREIFHTDLVIKAWTPVELLSRMDRLSVVELWSIGNRAPECINVKAQKVICLNNVFFNGYRDVMAIKWVVEKIAGYHKSNKVECHGFTPEEMKNFEVCCRESHIRFVRKSIFHSRLRLFAKLSQISVEEIVQAAERKEWIIVLNPFAAGKRFTEEEFNRVKRYFYAARIFAGSDNARILENVIWIFAKKADEILANHSVKEPFSFEICPIKREEVLLPENTISREYIAASAAQKSIILYGASETAREFLKKYGGMLRVKYVMHDPEEEADEFINRNYPVIRFHREAIGADDYVIICRSFVHNIDKIPDYALARDNFLRMGFMVCRDFTYYRIFEAIEEKKPIILFCGYCELAGMKQVLDLTSIIHSYCLLFYHVGRETMLTAPGFEDFVATAKLCDILVHAPLIVNRGVLDADVKKLVGKNTRLIFVPQINFKGYAPYKKGNYLKRNNNLKLFGICYYPFLYEVSVLTELIKEGKSNEEIFEAVSEEDLYSAEEIRQNLRISLKMLEIMDRPSDIPIYDFIEDNYRDHMLFKDAVHANDIVFFEYARRFVRHIGEEQIVQEIDLTEQQCRKKGVYFQVATEEPVLPCVAKALNLSFADKKKLYMQKVTDEYIRWRTFRQWVFDYCNYYRSALVVKRTLNHKYRTRKVTIWRNEEEQYSRSDGE